MTIVRSNFAGRNPHAGLPYLYVTAKLGPAQDMREIARSPKHLGAVLDAHAAALRRVLPVVDGLDLLLRCYGG